MPQLHSDVRTPTPARHARALTNALLRAGSTMQADGDVAVLTSPGGTVRVAMGEHSLSVTLAGPDETEVLALRDLVTTALAGNPMEPGPRPVWETAAT